MKRVSAVLIALLFVLPVHAAENWTYAASEHFDVYTTSGAGRAREALNYFERVNAFFEFIFKVTPKVKERTRLIVFSNDREFAPYRPNQNVAAFYQSGADRDYIVMGRLDEDSSPVVVHEYSHLFLRHFGGRYPVWLNEGMAEVFSTMRLEDGKVRFGDPQPQHLAYLKSGVALFDLNRLFAINHDSPEYNTRSHQGVLYAQSWALVHMLFVDDRYRPKWDAFAGQVLNGVSSAEALRAVYGKSPEEMKLELFNYIGRTQFIYLGTKDSYKASSTKYETRPADAFEGSLVTANLRANSPDGEADARAAYQKLEQERPNDLSLLESRAYFEWRRGKTDAALPYFERAVAQGSRNSKLVYDYARIDASKTAVLLPKALELAPDDIDIRLDNARLLLNERKGSQTVIALSKMDGLSREQAFKRYQLLANAYLMLNQPQEARGAATLAGRNADSDDRREYAARLLKSIDEYAAQRAQYEERVKAADAANAAALANATNRVNAVPDGAGASGTGAASDGPPVPRISMEMIRPPVLADNRPSDAAGVILIEGRLRNIICLPEGKGLVLEMVSGKTTLRLLIDRPEMVLVRGRSDGTVDLRCEAQDQPLTVGFVPGVNMTHQTEGQVRVLDYGK
jgi:hypothetical protein